ncbi:MAG: histidine phosphatase family protein [Casimicrobiaceae bacterium]
MPMTILLLRHGEEPKDANSLDLSATGRERAAKLASFIPKRFAIPDFIFSAAPTDASVRSYLTVRPLADSIRGRVDGSYKAREFGLLASKLLADPAFVGKLIVICWTHSELPALAGALNVRSGDFPEKWDEKVFNLVFQLTYKGRSRPKVKKVPEPF